MQPDNRFDVASCDFVVMPTGLTQNLNGANDTVTDALRQSSASLTLACLIITRSNDRFIGSPRPLPPSVQTEAPSRRRTPEAK
jgi:hypothetical protein